MLFFQTLNHTTGKNCKQGFFFYPFKLLKVAAQGCRGADKVLSTLCWKQKHDVMAIEQ